MPQKKPFKALLPDGPQTACLAAIRDHIRKYHISPTYDELALMLGTSANSPRMAVARLLRKGLLVRGPGSHRNLRITRSGYRELARKRRVDL